MSIFTLWYWCFYLNKISSTIDSRLLHNTEHITVSLYVTKTHLSRCIFIPLFTCATAVASVQSGINGVDIEYWSLTSQHTSYSITSNTSDVKGSGPTQLSNISRENGWKWSRECHDERTESGRSLNILVFYWTACAKPRVTLRLIGGWDCGSSCPAPSSPLGFPAPAAVCHRGWATAAGETRSEGEYTPVNPNWHRSGAEGLPLRVLSLNTVKVGSRASLCYHRPSSWCRISSSGSYGSAVWPGRWAGSQGCHVRPGEGPRGSQKALEKTNLAAMGRC